MVLKHLKQYLGGKITLNEFRSWFTPATWEMTDGWVSKVKLYIAEYTSGHRTEEELKEKLKEIANET